MAISLTLLALSVLIFVHSKLRNNVRGVDDGVIDNYSFFAKLFLAASLILGFIGFYTYLASLDNNAQLRAFHSADFSTYKTVAEKTEKMIVGGGKDGNLSVILKTEHLQQAPQAAARWAELRDKIEWYNYLLISKKAYYENWFLRRWIAEPPMELPNIKLE